MEMDNRFCPSCLAALAPDATRCPACGGDAMLENEPHQLPVGTLLHGRYLIGRCIGEGGFGITYVGKDTTLEMRVAVKEYYPTGVVNRYHTYSREVTAGKGEKSEQFNSGKRRVLDEARGLAKFSGDPNIVDVRDLFEENNTAYIVMEFLDGQTLQQVEKANGPLPFDQVYAWLGPVMDSLAKIHRQNLIHRDISPSNLMLLKNGTVKLLDFGTMRSVNPDSENSLSVMLKPGFAPEEQYRSHGAQGPWTDVYAMCASIYRLLTGVTPENAMNRIFDDTLQRPSQLGARISPAQEDALMRGLVVQASDRIQTMEALRKAFSSNAEDDEDDERTLYRPKAASDRPQADRGAQPYYAPSAPQEKAARPQPRARTDAPEIRPQPSPGPEAQKVRLPRPSATEAAPEAVQSASRERPVRGSAAKKSQRSGKKSRLPLVLIGIGVVAAAAVALFFVFGRNFGASDLYTAFGHIASLRETTVTEQALKAINRDSKITAVDFDECVISDDTMRKIADMKNIQKLDFDDCTGFTSLDPLSAMASLETLSLHGGPASKNRPLVIDGLLTGTLPQVRSLTLIDCETQDGGAALRYFPGLNTLFISEGQGAFRMDNASDMTALSTLYFDNTQAEGDDFSSLGALTGLSTITIKNTGLDDISWMAPLEKLRSLDISGCAVTTLRGLEGHVGLYTLTAPDNRITDISALSDSEKLQYLNLSGSSVSDLSPLAGCAALTNLNLTGNDISDISPLAGCTSMNNLVLNDMQLTNLDACEAMINLTTLEARNNAITDIGGLINTTQMTTVDLSDNRITDISPIVKNAGKLNSVFLGNNQIADLSPLREASELQMLGIEGNGISSLNALTGLQKLSFLSAGNNRISDLTPLTDLVAIVYLDLGDNEISDLRALSGHAMSNQVLLLQNNKISDFSALPANVAYRCLSLYGNPIADFSRISQFENVTMSDYLYLGWSDSADLAPVGTQNYYHTCFVDVPLDQRAPLIERMKDARAEKGLNRFLNEPSFISTQEADSDMTEIRDYARNNGSTVGYGLALNSALSKR